jgi:hypothetical protein
MKKRNPKTLGLRYVSFEMPESLYQDVKAKSNSGGTSMKWIMVKAVEAYLSNKEAPAYHQSFSDIRYR